jgi:hypothetical protein
VAHLELFGGSNQWNVSFVKVAHGTSTSFFNLFYSVGER